MEAAAGALAEICGEQYQGAADEQSEDCASAANHFAVLHGSKASVVRIMARLSSLVAAPPVVPRILVGAVNDLELLEGASGAHGHARQRALRQVRGHLRLLAQ